MRKFAIARNTQGKYSICEFDENAGTYYTCCNLVWQKLNYFSTPSEAQEYIDNHLADIL